MTTIPIPISKLFYSRFKNIITMLDKRGYDVTNPVLYRDNETIVDEFNDYEELSSYFRSLEEIDLIFESNVWIVNGASSRLRLVYVRELEDSKGGDITQDQLAEIIAEMEQDDTIERTIMVSYAGISSAADKKMKLFNSTVNELKEEQRIEYFHVEWFAIDRLVHRWVPQYTLLTDNEIQKLLRQIQAPPEVKNKLALFPTMSERDAIALYFGIKPKAATAEHITGKVFKIKRTYPVPRVSYRLVVEEYEII